MSVPAFAVGAGVMVIVIWSVTGLFGPFPVDVRVKVTVPAEISAALGVYTALSAVFPGLYVPLPPDHIPPVAPITDPLSVTEGLFAQDVWSTPAFTVGAAVIVIVITSLTELQFPFPVVVSVKVTVPAVISKALRV